MKRMIFTAVAAAAALSCVQTDARAQTNATARAELTDLKGKPAGYVELTQMPGRVLIKADLSGLSEGWHGFHIHENPTCEPPFASAGGHLNPGGAHHGFGAEGPHPGDLPNIYAGQDGRARVEIFTDRISIGAGEKTDSGMMSQAIGTAQSMLGMQPHDILSGKGVSVVVHAKPDDYKSDPAGNAGDRIACGVIRAR